MARLSELFSRTSEEGACLAVVEGPRGAGQGALIDRFADHARERGALVIDTMVRPGEPFSPLEEILDQALAVVGESHDGSPLRAPLACPHGCHELFFRHPGALAADPERFLLARRAQVHAFRRVFLALGGLTPAVLIIRGLDAASPDLLPFIECLIDDDAAATSIPRVFVIAEATGPQTSAAFAGHARVARVAVGGLDEETLREVLARPEVVAKILARTGGCPDAVDRLLAAELPTPEHHLRERRGRLSLAARAAFDALAVLGVGADAQTLAQVAGVAVTDPLVRELCREALAVVVAGSPDTFRLGDPADAERGRLLLAGDERRLLEARGAALMESRRHFDAASRHALRAGCLAQAVGYALQAAPLFASRHAHREAAAFLTEIAAGVGSDHRGDLDGALADALFAAGELAGAIAPARRAWLIAPADAAAGRRLARGLVLAGHLGDAEEVLLSAGQAARETGNLEASQDLAEARSELCFQAGRLDDAERLAGALLADSAPRLDAHQTYAKVALARGHLAAAEERYRAYELAASRVGSLAHEALAVGGLGVVMITAGDLTSAERALRRCAALGKGAQDKKAQALAEHNLAVVAHLRHDYARARERYEAALGTLSLVGNRSSLARVAFNLGELYESFGAYGRARAMCEYGSQVGGAATTPRAMAEALLLRGRVALAEGAWAEARAAMEAALETLEGIDPVRAAAAVAGLSRALSREGRLDDAVGLLASCRGDVDDKRRADLALARAEVAEARDDDPIGAAEKAVAAARLAMDERLLVEALVALGRTLSASGHGFAARGALAEATEVDGALRRRVPEDLLTEWEDRPVRREMLRLLASRGGRMSRGRFREPGVRHPEIVGTSAAMERVRAVIDRVGPSECNVLVRGESGTGKELAARALHRASRRSGGPLVAVNCAAIVESLLLSELFGHEKGAFTGAHGRQLGRFEQARGGTLFLDEVGDVSPAVQAALLRVVSERSFERVGGRETIAADVRIIAATNRDLEAMVRQGSFREDLYYRLNELSIVLPPLRERAGDVALLADCILERVSAEYGEPPKTLSREAIAALVRCPWPGNVRQLENALRAAMVLADGPEIGRGDLHTQLVNPVHPGGPNASAGPASLSGADEVGLCYARLRGGDISLRDLKKELERELVQRALRDCGGNISRAAGVLGMKRPRLSQLVKEYGLRPAIRGKGEC